jgi:hypothetical protein
VVNFRVNSPTDEEIIRSALRAQYDEKKINEYEDKLKELRDQMQDARLLDRLRCISLDTLLMKDHADGHCPANTRPVSGNCFDQSGVDLGFEHGPNMR